MTENKLNTLQETKKYGRFHTILLFIHTNFKSVLIYHISRTCHYQNVKSSQVFKFRFDLFNALTSEYILCNKSTLNTQSVDPLLQLQRPVCKMTLLYIKAVMEYKNIISYQLFYTCSQYTWSRSNSTSKI